MRQTQGLQVYLFNESSKQSFGVIHPDIEGDQCITPGNYLKEILDEANQQVKPRTQPVYNPNEDGCITQGAGLQKLLANQQVKPRELHIQTL